MSWRTTAAGLLAGLALLGDALAQDGPWTWIRGLRIGVAVAVAALGVWARDHAALVPPVRPQPADPRPPEA